VRVSVTNLYSDEVGNPNLPSKLQAVKKHHAHVRWAAVAIGLHLESEFTKLDTDRANALSQHQLNGDVRSYAELEQLVRREVPGSTLREAAFYFVAHQKNTRLEVKTFAECSDIFVKHQRGNSSFCRIQRTDHRQLLDRGGSWGALLML